MLFIYWKFSHVTAILALKNEWNVYKLTVLNSLVAVDGTILAKQFHEALAGFLVSLASICPWHWLPDTPVKLQ